MLVQYYFNLEDKLKGLQTFPSDTVAPNTKAGVQPQLGYEFIRETMMPRTKKYALSLSYRDHLEFLEYWNDTQSKKGYRPTTPGKKVL